MRPTLLCVLLLATGAFGCKDGGSSGAPVLRTVRAPGIVASGPFAPGSPVTVEVEGHPGDVVALGINVGRGIPFIGRHITGVGTVSLREPVLWVPLGTVPASGIVRVSLPIPSTAAPLTRFVLQAVIQSASVRTSDALMVRVEPPSSIEVPQHYSTIQGAVDAASDGQVILVAPGTYADPIDFRGKAVQVLSRAGAESTVIDVDERAPVAVRFERGEGAGSRLEGFTIRGATEHGITCINASPTITGNIVSGNHGSIESGGGGIYAMGASLDLENNRIELNSHRSGGGVYVSGPDARFVGNVIRGNFAGAVLGGGGGGGVVSLTATASFIANVIEGNTASGSRGSSGGGVACRGDTLFVNTILHANRVGGGGPFIARGGGGSIVGSATFVNCTITENTAPLVSSGYGGGIDGSGLRFYNCVIWGNVAQVDPQVTGTAMVSYSIVEGGFPGAGNLSAMPRLSMDHRQLFGSPSIDAGTMSAPSLPGVDFEGDARVGPIDIGADEYRP